MARVVSISERVRAFTDGVDAFDVDATSVGHFIVELERRFPGLGAHVERNMAISIDGEIHQDALDASLGANSEVVLIHRLSGG